MNINTEDYKLEVVVEAMKSYEYLETIDIDMKIDLDKALTSKLLTAEHRKVLFAIYNLEFNFMQASKLIGYPLLEVKDLLVDATSIVTAVMNGYKTEYYTNSHEDPDTLDELLVCLDLGTATPLLELTDELQYSILDYSATKLGDKLSKEVLRQQMEGMPRHIRNELFNPAYSDELYNSHQVSDRVEQGLYERHKDSDFFCRQARMQKVVYITEAMENFI